MYHRDVTSLRHTDDESLQHKRHKVAQCRHRQLQNKKALHVYAGPDWNACAVRCCYSLVTRSTQALRTPEFGAGKESRTLDLNLGKVALYQLSYSRVLTSYKAAC